MFYMDLKMMDPYAFFGLFYMFAYAVHGFEKPCVIIASEPLLRTYVFTPVSYTHLTLPTKLSV